MEMKKNSSILVSKETIKSVAIGGFDGMHIAHQELFKHLDDNGAIVSIESGYATITPKRFRQEHSKYPIYYYILENIKNLEGNQFVNLLKEEFINLEKIVVGFDFRFGKDRKNTANDLKKLFQKEVIIIDEVKVKDIAVHSRYIRKYIQNGDINLVNDLLGRYYKIYGKQIRGQGLGSEEFVPTINIEVKDFILPKEGVYITKSILNNKEYNSVSFIGSRKTTDNVFSIETHILDENIINKTNNVEIKFIKRLRDNKKFENFKELKEQIFIDIQKTKGYFN